jgi:hypothetical protein
MKVINQKMYYKLKWLRLRPNGMLLFISDVEHSNSNTQEGTIINWHVLH